MSYHTRLRRMPRFNRFTSLAGGVLVAAALLLAAAAPAFAQRGVTVAFLPDTAATMDIREAASPEKAGEYQLYVPSFMAFSRLPDNFNGAVWLRISLAPSFEKPVGDLQVNFGSALPGVTKLFIPQGDGFSMLENSPPAAVFTVPGTEKFPETLYARIDGTPGLWFRPILESANAENSQLLPPHMLIAGLFAAAMLLLLMQYIRKAEEWRLWAAITAGCGIVAAILPANPAAGAAYTPLMATAMLMPGLIIVFFAHTTRHLFNSPQKLAGYDTLLVVYYVVGAVIALLPLIPGFLYASRYLPLAFVILLPMLFIAMVALGRSLQGGAAFLCACLLTVTGVIVSAWELTASGIPAAGDIGGLAGLGLGLVLLGLTGPAAAQKETAPEEDVFDSLDRSCSQEQHLAPAEPGALELTPWHTSGEKTVAASSPEPVVVEEAPIEAAPEKELSVEVPYMEAPQAEAPLAEAPLAETFTASVPVPDEPEDEPETDTPIIEVPEAALGAPAPAITILDDTPAEEISVPAPPAFIPPGFEEHRKALFDLPMLIKEAYDEVAPLAERKNLAMSWFIAPKTGRLFEGDRTLVDSALRMLLRDMVEAMDRGNVRLNVRRLPDSKDAGHIVFTITEWDARKTFHARNMAGLSEAWALAEQTGGIFSVEHSPSSGTTVIFSSVFTAMDKPKTEEAPAERPLAPQENVQETPPPLPAEQAEQIAQTGQDTPAAAPTGIVEPAIQISVQPDAYPADEPVQKFTDHPDISLPDGLEIISVSPVPAGVDGEDLGEEEEVKRSPSRIIIADITASGRAKMRAAFADSPYSALEGTSPQSAHALYKRNPSALVIMSADMPEVDIAAAIQDMHAEDTEASRAPVPVLALVEYEAQTNRMTQIGCAKTLMKPVENEALLAAALELAPIEGFAPIPVPAEAFEPAAEEPPLPETNLLSETDPATGSSPEQETAPSPESALQQALDDIPGETVPVETTPPAEAVASAIFASALPADPAAPTEPGKAEEAETTGKTEETAAAPETAEKKETGRGLGLIDMIVTEEEEEAAEPAAPAESAPAPLPAPEKSAAPKVKATVTLKKTPKPAKAPSLTDPEAPLEDAPPSSTLVTDDGRPLQGAPAPSSGISIPLPGEEDSIFKDMMPLIPGLVHELTDAMADAAKGREEKSPMLVQEAAERVAGKAETFGLTKLERMARCVERAAAADDVEPMECVLDDLINWVERYKEALGKLHREQTW